MRLLGTRGRGPPRRVVPSQNGNASGTCAWVYDNFSIRSNSRLSVCLSETYCSVEYPRQLERAERRSKGMVAVRKWFGGGTRVVQATMRAIAPSMPPHVCPRQGRRRPSPSFCAAGAGGVATAETCGGAPAAEPRDSHGRDDSNDSIPPKVYRGEGYFATCADNACIIYSVPRAHLPSCPSPAATAFELLREGTEALPASAKCNEHLREATNSAE